MFDPSVFPPDKWEDLSYWEQIALLPAEEQEELLRDMIRNGVDINSPEIMFRRKQKEVLEAQERVILFAGGRGTGKLYSLNTPILTKNGFAPIGEIDVGTIIYDETGNETTVIAIYDSVPDIAYEFTFSDGSTLISGGEHQWVTWTHRDRKKYLQYADPLERHEFPKDWPNWRRTGYTDKDGNWREFDVPMGPKIRTTQEIVDTFRTTGKRPDLNHSIPLADPIQFKEKSFQVSPYLLGYWLGNGTTNGTLCAGSLQGNFDDDDIIAKIESDSRHAVSSFSKRNRGSTTISVTGLREALSDIGVLSSKHVPDEYLLSSEQQRLELLRGLMDSDGYADIRGSVVEFCSTIEHLADAVLYLARTLSERPVKSEGRATLNGVDYGPKWRVIWRPSRHNPFLLPRKANRINMNRASLPQALRHRHRMIKSYREVPVEPMRCLTVDSPNSMYLAGEALIPTHNTRVGGAWVNDKAMKHPGCIIHLVGRTVADVRDVMVGGESGLLEHAPNDFKPTYTPSTRSVVWPNSSRAITFSADASDQLRGPQSHYTWADELAAYPQKPDSSGATMFDNIEFSTRLGENPQILATTTPKRVHVMRDLFARAASGQNTLLVSGSSWENRSNLSREFMEYIFNRFAGTHLERQELFGELIGDSPGALWNSSDIVLQDPPKDAELITVIGVDPAVTYGNDDTGIVVACSTTNPDPFKRQAWILEDLTMNSPVEIWGRAVVNLQREYSKTSETNPRGVPAIIVVEKNQGGDLLKALFKAEGLSDSAPVVDVSAKVSKSQRAEPVVMAYRQKRVFHAEDMPLLVDELTSWEPGITKYSPGRLDALVWALAVLLVDPRPIARWAPILLSEDADYARQTLGGITPAWKRDRGVKTSLGSAPWRSRR